MSTYNYLYSEITCPYCRKKAITEVELFFGDTIFMDSYSIGDVYRWLPRKKFQNGGRPDNGDLDGEGYASCSQCDIGYYVKVLVRNDRVMGVVIDDEKNRYMDSLARSNSEDPSD